MSKFKLLGFDLLRSQVLSAVQENLACIIDEWAEGDSEIERLFFAALALRVEYGFSEFDCAMKVRDPEHAAQMRGWESSKLGLIVERQVQIDAYRVDFVVNAWTYGRVWGGADGPVEGNERWRKLVVECDGHDYHERTKEQAARDRSRDRALTAAGYDVFRFTGSELWRDPWACADQVIEWAENGYCRCP